MKASHLHPALPFPGTDLVGCAGWSIARETSICFPPEGSQLQRYGGVLGAVEINSSFYRPHRPVTYQRWASSVPDAFRFSVKLPQLITHELRLAGADQAIAQFAGEAGSLGEKLGCVLVQLPPSGQFTPAVADQFFKQMRQHFSCMLACEARHRSWFEASATALLGAHGITRVEADPPQGQAGAFVPTTAARYVRLHGSPKIYYSFYSEEFLADLRLELAQQRYPTWVIFDNTASGAAMHNALSVRGSCTGAWG